MFRAQNFIPSAHSELQKMSESDNQQCAICNCHYAVKRRDPRLLSCLHAICEPCLKKQQDVTLLKCKVCDAEEVGKGGTPIDYVRLNEHILFMAKHNPERLKCTNQNDGRNGRMYCFECNHFLCDQCVSFHSQLEATRNHLSVYLGDLTSHPLTEWQTKQKCSAHPDYPVSFFCNEESCRKLICLYCITKDHSGHNTQDIDEAFEDEKKNLKELSQRLGDMITKQRKVLTQQKQAESLRKQVYGIFDKIRAEISERHRHHQQILDFHYGEFQQSSNEKLRLLKEKRAKLEAFYDAAMAFNNDPEYKMMKEDGDNDEDDDKSASLDSDLVFVQVGLSNILKDIESFGDVKENSQAAPQE